MYVAFYSHDYSVTSMLVERQCSTDVDGGQSLTLIFLIQSHGEQCEAILSLVVGKRLVSSPQYLLSCTIWKGRGDKVKQEVERVKGKGKRKDFALTCSQAIMCTMYK